MSKYFWLIALVVFAFSRIATWLFPFDSDHWIFYYIGRRWAEGSTLYVDMWDHKSPLIFGYNSFFYKVFGDNIVLHRIFFTVLAILAIWLFYIAAKKLFNSLKLKNPLLIARISTLMFIFMANLSQFTNSGNNNENLALIFIPAMLYLYLLYRQSPGSNRGYLLASGALAGILFLLKANFAFFILPILIDIVYINRKSIFNTVNNLAVFAIAPLAILLSWILYFNSAGTLQQFIIASYSFNSKYIKALGWDFNSPGIIIFLGILALLMTFFALSLLISLKDLRKPNKQMGFFVPTLSISVVLFIILAGTFYSHYFLVAIPYLCLVFGATLHSLLGLKYKKLIIIGLASICLVMYLVSLKQIVNTFSGSAKNEADNQAIVAGYIKNHTNSDEKFFAYTYGATLYRLADRDSGTRFISASHPLIDYKYNFGYDFNTKAIIDMELNNNKYIVMSSDPNDIYRVQNPVLMDYFTKNYRLETSVAGYDVYIRNGQ